MKNIVGQPVRGKDFFERPKVIKKIWKALESSSDILISAPRRSGKSSIMLYLLDNPKENYNFIYIIVESIDNENEFFKRIYNKIIGSNFINRFEGNLEIATLGVLQGIDVRKLNYRQELIELLGLLKNDERIVIMIDEFSQAVENIIGDKSEDDAVHFLQSNREIRMNPDIKNVRFIYAGSIDLETIATKLGANSLVNDLYTFRVPPLSEREAEKFIRTLLENMDFDLNPGQVQYLIKKIQWLIPFFIQLFINELYNYSIDKEPTEITNSTIDEVLEQMLKHRNYFEHLHFRLRKFFKQKEENFVMDLLDILSRRSAISSRKIAELAEMYDIGDNYKGIVLSLVVDGYINDEKKPGIYRFNSPLLETWWYDQTSPHPGKKAGKLKIIKIRRIRIRHVKCFEDIHISIEPPGNTALIIGTNGRGKSTILQLISLGLSGVKTVPFPFNWKRVVKKGHKNGLFEMEVLFDNKPVHLKFKINGNDDSITCIKGGDQLKSMQEKFLLLAYGVNRSIKLEDPKPYKDIEAVATLFGENGYLKHIKVSANFEYVQENFKAIRELINKVLEKADGGTKVILTDYDSESFYFKTPSNPKDNIPIEALSEGFKSTFVWLFDTIIRIVLKGGKLENANKITGIILMDEIDLHLHPAWQRTILQSIETLFPNIQFIVTTHSPFVIQGARKGNLIVLELDKESNNVKVIDKNITSELSYNATAREIFDIRSPFSYEVELKMKEFREMSSAIRKNGDYNKSKFEELVLDIAGRGVELEGVMRREIRSLEQRTGKTFDLWRK